MGRAMYKNSINRITSTISVKADDGCWLVGCLHHLLKALANRFLAKHVI